MAVFAILTAEDINDTDDFTDSLLPHSAAGGKFSICATHRMIILQNTMQQVLLQGYVPHQKTLETYQIDHFRALSPAFLEQSCSLNYSCAIFEAYLINSLRFSEVFRVFRLHTPGQAIFGRKKGTKKFSDSKM